MEFLFFWFLTLHSWLVFIWWQLIVEDQNTDPQKCGERVDAGTSCYLINFRAVEIPIQMLPHDIQEKDAVFVFFNEPFAIF